MRNAEGSNPMMEVITPPLFVLCGGMGTRLGAQTHNIPKSLVPVLGEPFLAHQLRLLECSGFNDITLCTGHFGEQIQEFVDNWKSDGLQIQCVQDPPGLLGTGGALAHACKDVRGPICFTYGDSYLDIDFQAVIECFAERNATALMTVIDKELVNHAANIVLENGLVTYYGKDAACTDLQYIDYGFTILQSEILRSFAEIGVFDLSELVKKLVSDRRLQAFELKEPFHEIGTPRSLNELEVYLNHKGATHQ